MAVGTVKGFKGVIWEPLDPQLPQTLCNKGSCCLRSFQGCWVGISFVPYDLAWPGLCAKQSQRQALG